MTQSSNEYHKLYSRQRRARYYAEGLNAKGEPKTKAVGRPMGQGNSMWRNAINQARAGDLAAVHRVINELERRMNTAQAAYQKRRDQQYAKGLTANGDERIFENEQRPHRDHHRERSGTDGN